MTKDVPTKTHFECACRAFDSSSFLLHWCIAFSFNGFFNCPRNLVGRTIHSPVMKWRLLESLGLNIFGKSKFTWRLKLLPQMLCQLSWCDTRRKFTVFSENIISGCIVYTAQNTYSHSNINCMSMRFKW